MAQHAMPGSDFSVHDGKYSRICTTQRVPCPCSWPRPHPPDASNSTDRALGQHAPLSRYLNIAPSKWRNAAANSRLHFTSFRPSPHSPNFFRRTPFPNVWFASRCIERIVTAFRCCDLVSNAQSNPNPHSLFLTVSSSFSGSALFFVSCLTYFLSSFSLTSATSWLSAVDRVLPCCCSQTRQYQQHLITAWSSTYRLGKTGVPDLQHRPATCCNPRRIRSMFLACLSRAASTPSDGPIAPCRLG